MSASTVHQMATDSSFSERYTRLAPSIGCSFRSFGWTPLHVAVLTENPKLVSFILSQPTVDVNAPLETDFKDDPPALEIVRSEFCKSPLVDCTKGATPLHYACLIANDEIIKLLVGKGASYTLVDDQRRRPIEYFQLGPSTEPVLKMYNDMFQIWLKKSYLLDLNSLSSCFSLRIWGV